MSTILGFAAAGLLLGLSGGLAPGPLLALVASETLRHGVRAGVAVGEVSCRGCGCAPGAQHCSGAQMSWRSPRGVRWLTQL